MADAAIPISTHVAEYPLRLGASHDLKSERFVGTFPLGPPGFRERRGRAQWTAAKEKAPFVGKQYGVSKARQAPPLHDWVVTEQPGGAKHRGSREAGMAGSRAPPPAPATMGATPQAAGPSGGNYFLLVKRGDDFVVLPAGDWYTFRPVNARRGLHTLDQAEAQMRSKSDARPLRGPPRLAQMAAADPVDENKMAGGAPEMDSDREGGADSDTEERLANMSASKTSKGGRGGKAPGAGGAEEAEAAAADDTGEPRSRVGADGPKEGDWEFEDDRADDDVEMDPNEGAPPDDEVDLKKQKGNISDEDAPQLSDGERGSPEPIGDLSASGAALQRLLAGKGAAGGGSSEDDEDDDSLADDDQDNAPESNPAAPAGTGYADDDLDDEDDEAMLQNIERLEAIAAGGAPPPQDAAAVFALPQKPVTASEVAATAGGKKRKGTAPTQAAAGAAGADWNSKRQRKHLQSDAANVEAIKLAPIAGAAVAEAGVDPTQRRGMPPAQTATAGQTPTPAVNVAQPPTREELVAWLRQTAPVAMAELTKHFKKRLKSQGDRDAFAKTFKDIARHQEIPKGSGIKLVVLRNP
mmetsp:Transcript_15337/g.46322  ORF Transcript_15337/g.46322 Transcript_15337/m.46322 type:complete len:580 (+) Transcript_15337:482-2221(+)